jgi:hypothetical protein
MPFEKGNKYGGARKVKPFRDALMMEIKAAGDDHKAPAQDCGCAVSQSGWW